VAKAQPSETNERRFCWEQVLRTNRLFRISRVFAPASHVNRLLPLYALFGAVEELCSEHSDEDVARRKLDWWRNETQQMDVRGSDHPILRELAQSGAGALLRSDSLERLFVDAESRLDPAPLTSMEDLRERCRQLSQARFELELSLWGRVQDHEPSVAAVAVSSGLAQLFREAARRAAPGNYWWLPLSTLAQHGVGRAEIDQAEGTEPVRALFEDIIGECCERSLQAMPNATSPLSAGEPARHLLVIAALESHALGRVAAGRSRQVAPELNRVGLPQLFRAWNVARRVSRP